VLPKGPAGEKRGKRKERKKKRKNIYWEIAMKPIVRISPFLGLKPCG
jgi:hypothetical protein